MRSLLKKVYRKFYKLLNSAPFNNKYKLRGTKLKNLGKALYKCKFICNGSGNVIILHAGGAIRNTTFYINGNNNTIEIGTDSSVIQGDLYIEDDGNKIEIGNNTRMCGKIHLACTESKNIKIGDSCLFSSEIVFRTGDSHSLVDMEGNRINPAADVEIGDHVWVGYRVLINKGVYIAPNNMIGTGAIVTKKFEESNTVIAGVPAKVVKRNTNWVTQRI